MEDFIGVKCDEVGLTASNIKERIGQVTLTNGIMLELRLPVLKNPEWRVSIAEELGCLPNSLRRAITRVKNRYQRLQKRNKEERGRKASEAFLKNVFNVPKIKSNKPSQNKIPVNTPCSNCLTLVEGIEAEAKRRERRVRVQEQKIADSEEEMMKLKKIGITRLQDVYSIIGQVGTPRDVVREIKKLNKSKLLWESRFRDLNSSYKNLKTLHNRALRRSKSLQAQLNREKAKKTKRPWRPKQPTQQPLAYTDDLHCSRDKLQEQTVKLCSVQTNEGRQLTDNMRQVSYFIQEHQMLLYRRISSLLQLTRTKCTCPKEGSPHLKKTTLQQLRGNLQTLCVPWTFRGMATASGAGSRIVPQDFDYFLVLDFEATCLDNERIEPQEVIEFPVLKVSGKTFETESTFHQYVEPQVHGVGEFCTRLTGITPDMVKGQPTFEDTLKLFHIWMEKEGLVKPETKFIFVTCGDWDLKTMLPSQCAHFELPYHSYFRKWLNIKKAFATVTSHYPKGMMQMLEKLNIPHVGRHHSGIDDCRNIANILQALAHKRYKFKQTGSR